MVQDEPTAAAAAAAAVASGRRRRTNTRQARNSELASNGKSIQGARYAALRIAHVRYGVAST